MAGQGLPGPWRKEVALSRLEAPPTRSSTPQKTELGAWIQSVGVGTSIGGMEGMEVPGDTGALDRPKARVKQCPETSVDGPETNMKGSGRREDKASQEQPLGAHTGPIPSSWLLPFHRFS